MTDERIQKGLELLFDEHRIVFWYDDKQELRDAFEGVALDGVEKLEIRNNEFGLKYRMLREQPKQSFLVYKEGSAPEPATENWLLDIQLAHAVFYADQVSLWLNELGLGQEFRDLIQDHSDFFRAKRRLADLKALLESGDVRSRIREKMLFVCAGSEASFGEMIVALLDDHANGREDRIKLIERAGLGGFLWSQISTRYAYAAEQPSLEDFALALFKSALARARQERPQLSSDALIFFRRWKASNNGAVAFEILSKRYEGILSIPALLASTDWRSFREFDAFEAIERAIILGLFAELTSQTMSRWDVDDMVASRRNSHWYERHRFLYDAINEAARLLQLISAIDLKIESFEDGLEKYASTWFEVDQAYRKYIIAARRAGQTSLTQSLSEFIENLYANKFVLPLGDAWQRQVDGLLAWSSESILNQRDFYQRMVGPFRSRDQKVCVIISDAMRFEIGEELCRLIRSRDRFEASLKPMLAALPTFTQLGMAALLPHKTLELTSGGDALVLADGQSTQGSVARGKLLAAAEKEDGACAIRAEDFLNLNKEDARALTRDNAVVFIYHNQIDATGDKRETEERTFDAVEIAISDIEALVRKLSGANASHILITSDHGFLYQQRPLEESDFLASAFDDKAASFINRRFVIGQAFKDTKGFRRFTSEALGLAPGCEILSPKSINRLRRQGSGSRFVHGGAALQEAVIPVLSVTKARQSDIAPVEVEVITGGSRIITTNQFSVRFYQGSRVSEKSTPRTLSIGLYGGDGKLISDQHEVVFDATSDDARDRERTLRFLLSSEAGRYNETDVFLLLREQHAGTTHFKEYKSITYRLRNRISGDFDF